MFERSKMWLAVLISFTLFGANALGFQSCGADSGKFVILC